MAEKIYKKISEIDFSMESPEFMIDTSSAKIVTAELYEKEGYPVDGGLMDVHLGVIDPGLRCKTCGGKLKECMGHFGHIELARPIVHINYTTHVYNAIRSTCNECHRILLNDKKLTAIREKLDDGIKNKDSDKMRKATREAITKSRLIKKCPYCNAKQEVVNPSELLPRDDNSDFSKLNPQGAGDLQNVSLLKAGHHIGINTVGQSLRNANLQLRSEPPNPKMETGPWNGSTITGDPYRRPLEIGSN